MNEIVEPVVTGTGHQQTFTVLDTANHGSYESKQEERYWYPDV